MVLFGNTTDGSIGQSMMIDVSYYDYLYSELKMVLANEGVDVKYNRFIGNDCSPQNVNNYLDNLSCNGDIVFLFTRDMEDVRIVTPQNSQECV